MDWNNLFEIYLLKQSSRFVQMVIFQIEANVNEIIRPQNK